MKQFLDFYSDRSIILLANAMFEVMGQLGEVEG